MKPFNLAEARITDRAYCKEQLNRRLRVVALLAVLTLCVAAVSYGCKMSVRNKASRLKSELADVQGRCVQIKNEIAGIKAKSSQRKWQLQLADGSNRWLGVLDAILVRTPADVWLNRLESSQSGSNMTIDGQASSFASLSEFIGAMRSCPKLTDIRINSTRVSGAGAATAVDFSLQVNLKGAQPAQPATQSTANPQAVPPAQESP